MPYGLFSMCEGPLGGPPQWWEVADTEEVKVRDRLAAVVAVKDLGLNIVKAALAVLWRHWRRRRSASAAGGFGDAQGCES